jgi:hypothetical protein
MRLRTLACLPCHEAAMRHPALSILLFLCWPCAASANPEADALQASREALFALPPDGRASTTVRLPIGPASSSAFTMTDSRTLPADLLRRYPAMRSFRGRDDQGRQARLDYAAATSRLYIRGADGDWQETRVLPPAAPAPGWRANEASRATASPVRHRVARAIAQGNVHYEFRLALALGSRFVAAHGGTRDAALGAAVHLANRANEVLETDLGVHVTLAARNDLLIITDGEGDPLRHGEPRTAAAELIARRLPASSYDLGQALVGLDGGESDTGTVCSDAMDADYLATHKAAAWSGAPDPETALGHLLLVLGNQLGAPFRARRCVDCLAFDGESIVRVRTWLASRGGRCAKKRLVDAMAPWIDPEPMAEPRVVPARTPFWLDATVAPGEPGRELTYAWDDIGRPAFFHPRRPGRRLRQTFARTLPTDSRSLDFRLTVRDNGGPTATVASADTRVQVVDTGRAFAIEPVGDAVAGAPVGLRWDPAGTTLPPIQCHFLDVALSRDGGVSWAAVAKDVENSGSAAVTLPAGSTTEAARLRLSCDSQPFYAEAPGEFRIH